MLAKAKNFVPYFWLLLFCIIAYLPLSSFAFSLKNDAFVYNFPNKFFFSECLRHGYLPSWNPYLNFGFPLFADPGFAWWNPITWVFGILGYNAYTFTVEVLLYIYLSGVGMFWLGHYFSLNKKTKFLLACMFMCCGFFVGNLQHINFITCAAFLPWLTCAWLKYQDKPNFKNLVICGLFGYLLFTGGHPAIPIASVYFFIILTILYYLYFKQKVKLVNYINTQARLFFLFVIVLSPLLYSYITLLPYYSRSEPVNQFLSTNVGFTLNSYVSFFLPFATIKNQDFFSTDVSMRNGYFSLIGAVLLLQFLLQRNKNRLENIFIAAGLIMLVIGAGGETKKIVYDVLPGLNFIKTNGEFRVFAIFSFIICIANPLNQIINSEEQKVHSTYKIFKWLLITILISGILLVFLSSNKIIVTAINIEGLKKLIADLSFLASLKIALFTALILSTLYLFNLRMQGNKDFIITVILSDILINTWLLLPITGVGKTSVSKMQSIINQSPKGFPIENLKPGFTRTKISEEDELLIGNWSWYDKAIVHKPIDYPSQLKSEASNIHLTATKSKSPAFYLKNNNGSAKIIFFSPNKIQVSVNLNQTDTLILLQNYFPGWQVKDNSNHEITIISNQFIKVPIKKGIQELTISFFPFF